MSETAVQEAVAGVPRSRRGRERHAGKELTPLDEIRMTPAGTTGAWCYYLRPDGATIRDILVISPNGGVPNMNDQRLRARYGTNAAEYQQKARAKGYEVVGPALTPNAVRRIVEILAENREDEVLYCEDEIANCQAVVNTADRPEVRDQARKRRGQYERRLEVLQRPFDPDALLNELNEIARAQRLANIDPNVLAVMREMVGEVNATMADAVARFSTGKQAEQDPEMTGTPRGRRVKQADAGAEFATGKDFIDAD